MNFKETTAKKSVRTEMELNNKVMQYNNVNTVRGKSLILMLNYMMGKLQLM